MKADVVVIGTGISGLTAGALMAKKGYRVLLLEQQRRPGGALKRFYRRGIPFDVGFHYTGCLGAGQVLRALWDYLEIWPRLTVRSFPPEGSDLLHFEESSTRVKAYFSYPRLQDELCRVFPDEQEGVAEYLRTIRSVCARIPFYNLDLPLTPFLREPFGPARRVLAETIASCTQDPELQAVFASPAFLYGVRPQHASLAVHAMVAHAYYSGACAVDGGGEAILQAFLSALRAAGAEVRTGQKVDSIHVESGQVAGVRPPGGTIHASRVIYTGHPTHLPDLVPEGALRPAYCHRLRALQNTDSAFIIFGELQDRAAGRGLAWNNYYRLPPGIDPFQISPQAPEDSALLLTAPGARDQHSALSDSGRGIILMRPATWEECASFAAAQPGTRTQAYRRWKEGATEKLLRKASAMWGEDGRLTPLAVGTPLTFEDELHIPRGGIYGVQHRLDQYPPGARTRLPGLWLSGQGTLMTGVVGASLAGLVTVGEMEGLESLWEEVRQCR